MPKVCFVCKKNNEGIASFEVTKQRLACWSKCIDGLNVGHRICENHFSPNYIIKKKLVKDGLGNIIAEVRLPI